MQEAEAALERMSAAEAGEATKGFGSRGASRKPTKNMPQDIGTLTGQAASLRGLLTAAQRELKELREAADAADASRQEAAARAEATRAQAAQLAARADEAQGGELSALRERLKVARADADAAFEKERAAALATREGSLVASIEKAEAELKEAQVRSCYAIGFGF
eukprot:182705-Chlamydomonas_euryale.AAC.1